MKYLYKITAALLSLAVLPVLIFAPIFDYRFNAPLLELLKPGVKSIADIKSLHGLIILVKDLVGTDGAASGVSESLKEFIAPLISVIIFYILIAVFAILAAVLVFACKKRTPACFAAIFGIAFSQLFTIAFDSLFKPFVDGSISLATIFNAWWLGMVIGVEHIRISSAFYYVYMLFAAVLIWTAAYSLTETKDGAKSSYKEEI